MGVESRLALEIFRLRTGLKLGSHGFHRLSTSVIGCMETMAESGEPLAG
jgi:hypothetical protein